MSTELPERVVTFIEGDREVWDAFTKLSAACHEAGPLDEKSRRLVKIALAIGAGLEGGTHSAVRHAIAGGVTAEEMKHVAVLAITTLGLPAATRGWTWINDLVERPGGETEGE